MGEVYRATDTNLKRQVAIKVLPEAVAADAERLVRFQREAEVLASLNHPNIAIIHGLEKSDGVTGLVMELVEGPTLADRIAQGPIPIDEALPIAKQIAEALEAAHEQGIIHRDLKPANVKVRPDGTVKVLDFGLAKAMEPAGAAVNATLSPTITTPAMTQAGVILGTAAYMSPEQVRSRNVGRRSDVWAFGCVMYEMLTGRQAFSSGETVADTLAGVLTHEPDWDALPATTPLTVGSLIRRCLRKDARRRLPDIAQARIELEDAAGDPTPALPSTIPTSRRHERLWAAVAIVSLIAAAAFGAWITLIPKPDARVIRFDVYPPPRATFVTNPGLGQGTGQPLSPDGRTLAFVAVEGGRRQIWVYPLDSAAPRPLPGTENATRPAWSPDSRSLAFFAEGQLEKVRVDGGPSTVICDGQGRGDVAWGTDEVLLLGGRGGPLLRVPSSGGQAVPATELGPDETTHDYPDFLPDGRQFVYMARRGTTPDRWDVYVGSLDSADRHLLPGIHAAARISPTGHVVFQREGTLMAQPLDLGTLALWDEARPLAEGAYTGANAPFSMSTNGTLAYVVQEMIAESHLVWIDRNGKQLAETGPAGEYRNLDLSPDGNYVAFDRGSLAGADVFVLDLERGSTVRVTPTAGLDAAPLWSPDGQSIVYMSSRDPAGGALSIGNAGAGDLYARGVGVVADDTLLLKTNTGKTPTDWSPSGYLAYTSRDDVWALSLPISGDSKPIQVTNTSFRESNARISPNGRWIAYQSNESASEGQQDVYVQSFPQPGSRQQVSTRGGGVPRWSPDGRELFYLAPDLTLMSVSIESVDARLRLGPPERLFQTELRNTEGRDYDVAAGGRFLFNVPSSEPPAVPITVILNWPEILAATRAGS